jgi:hypothetical protein
VCLCVLYLYTCVALVVLVVPVCLCTCVVFVVLVVPVCACVCLCVLYPCTCVMLVVCRAWCPSQVPGACGFGSTLAVLWRPTQVRPSITLLLLSVPCCPGRWLHLCLMPFEGLHLFFSPTSAPARTSCAPFAICGRTLDNRVGSFGLLTTIGTIYFR